MSILHYKLLNVVDSIQTFNNLTNKNEKSLYFVKTDNGYLLYKGDTPINLSTTKPATDSELGAIKGSSYLTIRKDGSVIINKANKLARKVKLGDAYFDGGNSISLLEMGAISNKEYDQYKITVSDLFEKIQDKLANHTHTATEISGVIKQIAKAEGGNINLPSTFNGGLLLKELQGKSVQNGVPSPTNKVDIVSVGDDGSVVVKVTGKNLMSVNVKSFTEDGITIINNNDGSLTINGTAEKDKAIRFTTLSPVGNVNLFDIRGNYSFTVNNMANIYRVSIMQEKTWKVIGRIETPKTSIIINNANDSNLFAYIDIKKGAVFTNQTFRPQLELGTTSTTYEPYKEQLITIPLTQPLRSVGSVCDRIIKKDGVWSIERNITSVVFDGSSDELLHEFPNQSSQDTLFFQASITTKGNLMRDAVMSNRFPTSNKDMWGTSYNNEAIYIGGSFNTVGYNQIDIRINKSRLDPQDRTGLRTWLKANPMIVNYLVATPTFEPLSQSVQDQLNKLQTYQGVTNVFTTDTQQPNMIVEYGTTDTSALSIYTNNINDSKLNKVDLPASIPTEGGNADTVDGKHASDFAQKEDIDNISKTLQNQIGSVSGESINITNTHSGGLLLKELQGKSVQDGTPTPTNKVDIVSVGDDGSVVVKVCGKNLLNYKITETIGSGITYVQNSDGTITLNGTATTDMELNCVTPYTFSYKFNVNVLKLGGNHTGSIRYITFDKKWSGGTGADIGTQIVRNESPTDIYDYMYFRIVIKSGAVCNNLVLGYMVQKDNITTYEPYKEQLITIPLTQPLRSVGSVCDRIIKKDGVRVVERNINKAALRSISLTDVVESSTNNNFWKVSQYLVGGILNKGNDSYKYILCDRIAITKQSEEYSNPVFNIASYSHKEGLELRINAPKSLYPTKESVVAFLNSVTWNFIYVSRTSTFEPLSHSIQDELNKLQTYQRVTNIFTTDKQRPNMIVEYGKTDTSALSIYTSNISGNNTGSINGGDADTLDGKHASDFAQKEDIDNINKFLQKQIISVNGESINITNAHSSGLLLKELQGKSVQIGVPSPTNKVDIVSVGDDGSVTLKVCGKNLLNINAMSESGPLDSFSISNNTVTMNVKKGARYALLEYSLFLKAGTYTLSNKSVNAIGVDSFRGIGLYRLNYYYGGLRQTIDLLREERTRTFTLNKDTQASIVMYAVGADSSTSDVTVTFEEAMLEVGSNKTSYEPYKEQLITIPLTQPLRSVGSVHDRIIKEDGVWIKRNIASVVFDGSSDEDWRQLDTVIAGKYRYEITVPSAKLSNSSEVRSMCDRLVLVPFGETYNNKVGYNIGANNVVLVYIDGRSLAEFKTWLKSNPLTVNYQLETPTFEPLSQSIQDQLNKLQTYQGVVNIFTTDPQQPNMMVEYTDDFTVVGHDHDNIYYTESEIDAKLKTKANTSHIHTKAQITDFPKSLPANGGNADTVGGKRASDMYRFKDYTILKNNTDLNTIKTYGQYAAPSRASAETMNNKPIESAFTLTVECAVGDGESNYIRQIFKHIVDQTEYRRMYDIYNNGGTWTAWSRDNDGGNANTLGGLSSSDYRKTGYKALPNESSLFSYVLNDMKDSTSEVVRIYDGTDVPIEHGYAPKANDFIFHIDKIDHGYSIIRAHDNRSNREFMIKSNSSVWSRWKEVGYGGMTYLRATNVDLFAYIDGLTDEEFPPNSTVLIRAFNCKNSPLDGYPATVEYSLSNGGDFIIEASRLEGKDWCVLTAREIHNNKIFTCGKRGGVWKTWSDEGGNITLLPDGIDLEKDFLNKVASEYPWSVRTFRIFNSESAPTSLGYDPKNNDFYYTVYKMGHDWMKIEARDVRSNREFVNSKLGGPWTGWVEMIQTNPTGHIIARREQGGRQPAEGGQINIETPTLTGITGGNVNIDIAGNYLRIFEDGGTNRGAVLDIPSCSPHLQDKILTSKNITVGAVAPASPSKDDLWIY